MGCNCKKNQITRSAVQTVTPKNRGLTNGKRITKVKRVMRRIFK